MASTTSHLLQVTSMHQVRNASPKVHSRKPAPLALLPSRRNFLFTLTAGAAMVKVVELPAKAEDIGLFGIRKKLKKAEEVVEEVVKEGFETADKGLESAEKGIESAEKGLESAEKGLQSAEKEVETVLAFGGLAQAGVVAAAEAFGVLVATSVVNGILKPEGQKS